MPKLWSDTIEAHRLEVRRAVMDTTWALAREHGPLSVSMSQVASQTGIGRATLYKYFPDVETILQARHAEHVGHHLERLTALRDRLGDPGDRLEAVARSYAEICRHRARHGSLELFALTHQQEHVAGPEKQLRDLFYGLVEDAASVGAVRSEMSTDELTTYLVHALAAAGELSTDAAVHRLVALILSALRPLPAGG